MTLSPWSYQNPYKHLPGKIKSSKWTVRHKAWEVFWKCWGSKEQAKEIRTSNTKLYSYSSDLGSGWTHVATEAILRVSYFKSVFPYPLPGQYSSVPDTEQRNITRAWGQNPPLPPTRPSCQRLGVKPIPILPSRIRTPFRICSVKRTLQLALLLRSLYSCVSILPGQLQQSHSHSRSEGELAVRSLRQPFWKTFIGKARHIPL